MIFRSYFFAGFFFPLVFLGTILASTYDPNDFDLSLCLSQNHTRVLGEKTDGVKLAFSLSIGTS